MSKELNNIEVLIGSRTFGLSVEAEEEAIVQQASQLLNERLSELRKTYKPEQKSDYLAMASLLLSVDLVKRENELGEVQKLSEEIRALESRIDKKGR